VTSSFAAFGAANMGKINVYDKIVIDTKKDEIKEIFRLLNAPSET